MGELMLQNNDRRPLVPRNNEVRLIRQDRICCRYARNAVFDKTVAIISTAAFIAARNSETWITVVIETTIGPLSDLDRRFKRIDFCKHPLPHRRASEKLKVIIYTLAELRASFDFDPAMTDVKGGDFPKA